MESLDWSSIHTLIDTFSINVLKCKLCTDFVTTQRSKSIAHIYNRHTSVRDGEVVINEDSHEQTCDTGTLEELCNICEFGLIRWGKGTEDKSCQSDSGQNELADIIKEADMTAEVVLEESLAAETIQKGNGKSLTRYDDAVKSNVAARSHVVSTVLRSSTLTDGSIDIVDDSIVNTRLSSTEIDYSNNDTNTSDKSNQMDAHFSPTFTNTQELEQIEVDNDLAHDLQSNVRSANQQEKILVNASVEQESITRRKNGQTCPESHRRAGLRSPELRKQKHFLDCVEDEPVVSTETSISNSDLPYKCDMCDFTTEHIQLMKGHQWTPSDNDYKKFICLRCKKQYTDIQGMRRHKHICDKTKMVKENKADLREVGAATLSEGNTELGNRDEDKEKSTDEGNEDVCEGNIRDKPQRKLSDEGNKDDDGKDKSDKAQRKSSDVDVSDDDYTESHEGGYCSKDQNDSSVKGNTDNGDRGNSDKAHRKVPQPSKSCHTCICGFVGKSKVSLKIHMHKHAENRKPKLCDVCGFECKSETSLKIHMHRHEDSRKPRIYECDLCGKKYTSKKGMTKHKQGWCRKGEPRAVVSYECAVCKKEFHNKMIYKEHLTVHSAIRSHVCNLCQKAFKTNRALQRHADTHGGLSYTCNLCDFETKWKGSLKTHFITKHNSESRPIQKCPQCPFTTRSAFYISKHIMIHSEERPFMCEHCGKNFKSDIVLRAHLEMHDSSKQFPCDKCDYVGGTRMALYNHRASHIPKDQMQHRCEHCDWVGKRKNELHIHMRKHSALKLFRCGHCGQSYKHKHGLTKHLKEKHMVQMAIIPEVIFPDLSLENEDSAFELSTLPVAQFFEISTEILTDSNSQ